MANSAFQRASTVEVAGGRPRAQALALVRAVPAWLWLAAIVTASVALRYLLGRRMPAPWIMVDELIYSELAKSFAATGDFLVRGQSSAAYGLVYPVLISPAYRIFGAVPDAYAAAKAINAVLMSLAAVPAYFLARRVLGQRLSLLAAALTVAVPSMAYTGTLMTENAFYPLFLCAALALVLTLERPTVARQLVLLGLLVLAYLTRAQAVALLPAIATAPLLLAWIDRRGRRSLAAYRWLYGVLASGVVAVVVVQVARGRSPLGILGAYQSTGRAHYSVGAVARWLLYHVAELDLYLGVAPFAGLVLLAVVARGLPRAIQAFVAAALALSVWLALEVAAFASLPSVSRVEERNLFYLAPLAFVALLAWIDRGAPRPPRAAALVALVAAALPGVLPYHTLIGIGAVSDTLALLPWWTLQDTVITLSEVAAVAVLSSIAVAVVFLLVPRRFALVLPLFVLAYYGASIQPVDSRIYKQSLGALFSGITSRHEDWVDRAAGQKADVSLIWTGNTSEFTVWENEFFNRSVRDVYTVGPPVPGGLPQTRLSVDQYTGLMRRPGGRDVPVRYVLADDSVLLEGRQVARDRVRRLVLYRVDGLLRSTTRVSGIYPDTWSGPRATYTRQHCGGGRLKVLLESDSGLFTRKQTVVARSAGRTFETRVVPGFSRTMIVPLEPRGGRCQVAFTVRPTAIPAVVIGGGDTRRLGIHFSRFQYLAPGT